MIVNVDAKALTDAHNRIRQLCDDKGINWEFGEPFDETQRALDMAYQEHLESLSRVEEKLRAGNFDLDRYDGGKTLYGLSNITKRYSKLTLD